jgi:hypothetical protein
MPVRNWPDGWNIRPRLSQVFAMSTTKATSTDAGETEDSYECTALPSVGKINVANLAHGRENVTEHTYTVSMDDGRAVSCTCPSDKYHDGACKHREAVESRDTFVREGNCPLCGDTGEHDGLTCFYCVKVEETIEEKGR